MMGFWSILRQGEVLLLGGSADCGEAGGDNVVQRKVGMVQLDSRLID